jgi:hypothetical protein
MFVVNRGNETGSSQEAEYSAYSDCCLPLVFLAVLSRDLAPSQKIPTEVMGLIRAALLFLGVCAFSLALCIFGELDSADFASGDGHHAEHLLICARVDVVSIEMLLFSVEVAQQIRKGCFVIIGLLCIFFSAEFKPLAPRCFRSLKQGFPAPELIISCCLSLESFSVSNFSRPLRRLLVPMPCITTSRRKN